MKKRFLSKSLIAKIALVLVIIILLQFSLSEPVRATSFGGTLLNPVVNLVVYLGDSVITIMQSALLGMEKSFQRMDLTVEGGIINFIKTIAICVVAVALVALAIAGAVFSIPLGIGAAVSASTAGVITTLAARNRSRSNYCIKTISNYKCSYRGYVWKYFCILKYSCVTRIYIKKSDRIF